MKRRFEDLVGRLKDLEQDGEFCPRCRFTNAQLRTLSDEDLRSLIAFLSGECAVLNPDIEKVISQMPEPSAACPNCRKYEDLCEEQADSEAVRLSDILRTAI